MNYEKFSSEKILSQLKIDSDRDKKLLEILNKQLLSAVIDENIVALKGMSFAHENSDFFSETSQKDPIINTSVQAVSALGERPSHRVFIRDTPVRDAQLKTSVPLWAVGAAVDKSIGPFINNDGRNLWYDFYPIEELIALYVQGNANPVLLFHISMFRRFFENIPFVNQPASSYQLTGNTIWIYSKVLTGDAPAGYYTGLKIKGGSIGLSEAPQNINGQLMVNAGVTITVQLQLDQPAITNADATSDYGKDARAASLNLPQQFNFSFSGNTAADIQTVSNAEWNLYGSQSAFVWNANAIVTFDVLLNEVLVPFIYTEQSFAVRNNLSAFNILAGNANVEMAAWALPVAQIDINNPTSAEGIGALTIRCKDGLSSQWAGMQNGAVNLSNPYIQLNVGKVSVLEFAALNLAGTQKFLLWKDAQNPHRSSIELFYNTAFPFLFLSDVTGSEMIIAQTNTIANVDRPVTVDAHALDIKTKNSLLFISATKTLPFVYLYDDNILGDNATLSLADFPQPVSFALQNAVFKTTKTNGCLLFGELAENFINVEKGNLYLSFGIFAYLPILPDPYAANLGILKEQFAYQSRLATTGAAYQSRYNQQVWLLLIATTKWFKKTDDIDDVDVSFSFAPLPQQEQTYTAVAFDKRINNTNATTQTFLQHNEFVQEFNINNISSSNTDVAGTFRTEMLKQVNYQNIWDDNFNVFQRDMFSLLDVSSHANQMGVSFQLSFFRKNEFSGNENLAMYKTHVVAPAGENSFPLQVEGMNVVTENRNAKAFTLPQVSWEPLFNLSHIDAGDPPLLFNYYPNDGGATKLFNNSVQLVPVAPIPVTHAIIKNYAEEPGNITAAYFTLPFGMRSLAFLYKTNESQTQKPNIRENRPSFDNKLKGGIQLRLDAGSGFNDNEDNQFRGVTLQMNNVLNLFGNPTGASTLGVQATSIFNLVFFEINEPIDNMRGVPLKRFDISGYGASMFSNWQNKKAKFADVSQAEFEVFVGRTAHEVVQVKSILYPWGIHVVRTITIFRSSSGYEYRHDSGWKAEDDGKFDFSFELKDGSFVYPYEIHPGVIKGLFNVKNITPATDIQQLNTSMDVNGFYDVDPASKEIIEYTAGTKTEAVSLSPVYFDADIEIENVIQGQVNNLVPAKKILGFIQLSPTGIPLTPVAFADLLNYQQGSIGGPVNCVIDVGMNGQQLRANRIDVNISVDKTNTSPVFVAALRGNAILPKEGSWSMVTHLVKTGEVTPLPTGITVPLIRIGDIIVDNKNGILYFPSTDGLLRIANPKELLRLPVTDTINYGFLQSTNTQKVLFLTPAYQKITDPKAVGKLMSKTPPLFVDAYRLISSKGIFPNIGDAVSNYGDAIPLNSNFRMNAALDAGKQLFELMQINQKDATGKLLQEGLQLLKQDATKNFTLPTTFPIITTDAFKVYLDYSADIRNSKPIPDKPDGSPDYNNPGNFNTAAGNLNYDVNSFATDTADKWKSKMNNVSMVVDLGPFTRLVTIKGNFNSQNGSEAAFAGNDDPSENFLSPQIQFSDALQVVMDILQVLIALQGKDYKAVLSNGLKIAMTNSADSWSYKFEASQEIPLIRFPTSDPPDPYDDPTTLFKLEASLKLGIYFSETLQVTTNPSQLLPTGGAYLEFIGSVSQGVFSLAIGTIFAVGKVDLKIGADTSNGISLDMKFGFGAQVVVGLPLVANVSLMYMLGTEIYLDSNTITVTAFILYQGHAELIAGLVGITISIEAQGAISRSNGDTICAAGVTFTIDISVFLVIDIDKSWSWTEQRKIA